MITDYCVRFIVIYIWKTFPKLDVSLAFQKKYLQNRYS